MDMADRLVDQGYKDLGYEFVNIDVSNQTLKQGHALLCISPLSSLFLPSPSSLPLSASIPLSFNPLLFCCCSSYTHTHTQDCWDLLERDENGRLQPDPDRFPSGIRGLADYVCLHQWFISTWRRCCSCIGA